MLEHWRYLRALEASKKWPERDKKVFLDQELLTQLALANLGIALTDPPSKANKVGRILINMSDLMGLRKPYGIEILGMPGAGKTTLINMYLESLWSRNIRQHVHYIGEGVGSIKNEHGHLREDNPFLYSMMGGNVTFQNYIHGISKINSEAYALLTEHGQVDRRIFRRTYFSQGKVNPGIMRDEAQFIYGLENTPVQLGGIIMLIIKPETSFYSRGNDGTSRLVRNMDTLPRLYEQYWRLHGEILAGTVPYRHYQCIDAEAPLEEVYTRFAYTMDLILHAHNTLALAISQAHPQKFDQMLQARRTGKMPQTPAERIWGKKLGGKVLVVGGDDMNPDDTLLDRKVIEVMRLNTVA